MIYNEFKVILKINLINLIFIISLLILIIITNFLGLFPYIFTLRRHMVFRLRFSLVLWFSYIIYGFVLNSQNIIAHILPIGTPKVLIVFIILIETIRNIIRPITLSIRLSANIIAGHLLLTLLGNQGNIINNKTNLIIINTQIVLLVLELAVAIIQGYVFIILISLYTTEVH